MHQFARILGYLSMFSGAILLVSPGAAKEITQTRASVLRSLADWTLDFGQLSHGALRVLGAWFLLTGTALVWVTTKPAAEVRVEKPVAPELRKAA